MFWGGESPHSCTKWQAYQNQPHEIQLHIHGERWSVNASLLLVWGFFFLFLQMYIRKRIITIEFREVDYTAVYPKQCHEKISQLFIETAHKFSCTREFWYKFPKLVALLIVPNVLIMDYKAGPCCWQQSQQKSGGTQKPSPYHSCSKDGL